MLVRLTKLPDTGAALRALEEIFFLSTTRTSFPSDKARAAFFHTWTGWYLENEPWDVWFWRDPDGSFGGYLTGCLDSMDAEGLFKTLPKYGVFDDLFPRYPAHLHVNVHPNRRGHGIGQKLVERFVQDCIAEEVPGVHVVTAHAMRNVGFYNRLGFTDAVLRKPLLFLGRPLNTTPGTR